MPRVKKKTKTKIPVDPVRKLLIDEIKHLYKKEGFSWLLKENPLDKYTTTQLQIHVEKLRTGYRSWKIKN